jgi:hypothetical protein
MPGGTPKQSDEVVYIGGATVRRISSSEWDGAGIKDQNDLVWDARNNKRVKVSDLSKSALDFLMTHHPREFAIASEGERPPLPVDQPNPDAPAPNGQ